MTPEGESKLILHEGEILHAYQDSLGYWSIGIGHLIDKRLGGAIPQRVSRMLFEDDTARATALCRVTFPWFDSLDPIRQDAFINLMFNLGPERLGKFHNMLGAVERQDWEDAAFELFNSLWAKQVQKQRRDDLMNALADGVWK